MTATHADTAARAAFADDPAPDGLPAARIAVEHLTCHGQPLQHVGSTYAQATEHRFACRDPRCPLLVTYRVEGTP